MAAVSFQVNVLVELCVDLGHIQVAIGVVDFGDHLGSGAGHVPGVIKVAFDGTLPLVDATPRLGINGHSLLHDR